MPMKKLIWAGVALCMTLSVVLLVTKPNESDYVTWMQNHFDVQCLNKQCHAFEIYAIENGQEKVVTMTAVHRIYSQSIFCMTNEIIYRNLEDSSYKLVLKVKGYFGKIKLVNKQQKY